MIRATILSLMAAIALLITPRLGSAADAVDPAGPADLSFGEPVSDDLLDAARAGADTPSLSQGDATSQAGVDNNVVYSSTNGDNSVSGGAFMGAGSFSTVIQNSGNNVSIQSSTIVNLTIKP